MATPIVRYGFRDDDDDSDAGGRRGIFAAPRQLKKLGNPKKKLGRVLNDTRTLLKGAKVAGQFGHLYGPDSYDDEDEDSSSSYESESSDDDGGSVCSKSSVASKTRETLKKLGSSFRDVMVVNVGGKRSSAPPATTMTTTGPGEKGAAPEHDDDDDDDDDDDEDCSVASRASEAVKMVTGQISKALKVVRGRKDETDSSDDDDSGVSESTEEEDLLEETSKSRLKLTLPSLTRSRSQGEDNNKMHSSFLGLHRPRRHTSGPPKMMASGLNNLYRKDKDDEDDDDGHLSDLSDEEEPDRRHSTTPYNNNWSMNVTDEIWERAVQEKAAKKGGYPVTASKNLVHVETHNKKPHTDLLRAA